MKEAGIADPRHLISKSYYGDCAKQASPSTEHLNFRDRFIGTSSDLVFQLDNEIRRLIHLRDLIQSNQEEFITPVNPLDAVHAVNEKLEHEAHRLRMRNNDLEQSLEADRKREERRKQRANSKRKK